MSIKYTPEDIERIYTERVTVVFYRASLKAGIIAEFCVTFPNKNQTADVVSAYCIDPQNNNEEVGKAVCRENIKARLWNIVGQYSLATNEKL